MGGSVYLIEELTSPSEGREKPLVTVLTATYNRADMVGTAIESVLLQTMEDWELLVFNDASPDEGATDEAVMRYADLDKRIRYFVNTGENQKFPFGHNWLITKGYVRGRYVAYCDDDDRFYPRKLAIQTKFLEENPKIGLIYSDIAQIRDGRRVNYWGRGGEFGEARWNKQVYLFGGNNWIQPLRVLHRSIGATWDCEPMDKAADYEFFKSLLRRGMRFAYLPVIVGEYLWHGGAVPNNSGVEGFTY